MRSVWPVKKIGEVCDLMTGGTPSRSKPEYFDGDIKWLVSGDIHRMEIRDCEGRISEAGLRNSNAKYLPINSVLIALNGQGKTRGTVAMLRTKATCNQSLVSILPKDVAQLLPEFVYINLHGRYEEIRRITGDKGNERRGLNMPLIRNIEIPVPPIRIQEHIVNLLTDAFLEIDKAVANAEKNLANARELFESCLDRTFSEQPNDWVRATFGEICSIKHGFAFKSKFFDKQGKYVVLTPGSFFESGGFRDQGDKTKYYCGEIPDGYILSKGDFLIAMTEQAVGLLGSSLIVPESDRYLHNQRLGLVQVNEGLHWHNDFFLHQFNTVQFRAAVQRTASGLKVRHTSPKKLCEISVSYPPTISAQRVVADRLNSLLEQTNLIQSTNRKKLLALAELRKSLLQKVFSGQLAVDDTASHAKEAVA